MSHCTNAMRDEIFLYRDVDETKSWMNEKDTALLSDDYGRDLASVQALQRKHEGLERDLAALEDRVTALGEEARRLQGRHPSSADQIAAKQAEIVGLWEGLKHKVCVCCMLACGRGSNTKCVLHVGLWEGLKQSVCVACGPVGGAQTQGVCVLHVGLWEGLKHKVCVACWPVGGAQTKCVCCMWACGRGSNILILIT